MGYELHIFRRNNWEDDEEESNISLDEWLHYIENDKELELTNGFQDVFKNWQDSPGLCNWIGHPKSRTGEEPWFIYWSGSISTKYPDDSTIKKMVEISVALSSKVQGDDGEFYDYTYFDKSVQAIADEEAQKPINQRTNNSTKKPWWKFW